MPSGERLSFNGSESEHNDEATRATYEARGKSVLESISLSELASIDIQSLSDQELEDLNNRLKADISQSRARLGLGAAETSPAEAPAEGSESSAEAPEPAAEAPEPAIDIPAEPVPDNTTPEEILGAEAPSTATAGPAPATAEELIAELPDAPDEAEPEPAETEPAEAEPAETEAEEPESAEAEPAKAETITPEEAKATYEKAKKKPGFKRFLKKAIPLAVAVMLALGVGVGAAKQANVDAQDYQPGNNIEQNIDYEQMGIFDGYDEEGMWESDAKAGPYNFAAAQEVADVCYDNEHEMVKYTADNQVESYASYLSHLPEELQPDGFKGLSILETEDALEALSDQEFEEIQAQFNDNIDKAKTRQVVLDGKYDNAYMRLKDDSGAVTHENMELVKCTTNENGTVATEFYWVDDDGNEIGSMIVKTGTCMQVVTPMGDTHHYTGMSEIPSPGYGDPTPEPGTGSEGTGSETTGEESTGSEDTGEEDTGDEGTGDEGTDIEPKDPENIERIDDNAEEDIEEDIGTDDLDITPTPTEEVENQTPTEAPSDDDYQGTEASTTENESASQAEQVQEQTSSDNNYSSDNGGSHSDEYSPVKDNKPAQEKADKAEVSHNDAPSKSKEAEDTLDDLGIE